MPARSALFALVLPVLGSCVARTTPGEGGSASSSSETSTTASTSTPTTTSTSTPTTGVDPSAPTTTTSACEPYTYRMDIPLVVPSVLLALDQSPAMLDPWDHDGDPQTPEQPRWASVRNALLTVLAPSQHIELGLAPFPTADAEDVDGPAACAITPGLLVPTSDAPAGEVLAKLAPAAPAPGSFVGGAPLRKLLAAAHALVGGPPDQPRLIVMFANSAPNCDPDALGATALLETLDAGALDAAAGLFDTGIRIFVFGLDASTGPSPGVDDHRPDGVIVSDRLKALGEIGGGFYFNAASEAELIDELDDLFEPPAPLDCTLMIEPAPGPDQVVTGVRIDGEDFPEVPTCDEHGWQRHDAAVELCGAACTHFRSRANLEIFVTCV